MCLESQNTTSERDIMAKYTEKKKQSNKKWDEANLRNGSYKMPIELYENFNNYCKSMNISKNKIINELVREKLEKDGYIDGSAENMPDDEQ